MTVQDHKTLKKKKIMKRGTHKLNQKKMKTLLPKKKNRMNKMLGSYKNVRKNKKNTLGLICAKLRSA